MPGYFDTSALAKNYHNELGSVIVTRLIEQQTGACFISRLVVLEMESVLAIRLRMGTITLADALLARDRLRSDLRQNRFRLVALKTRHMATAESLLEMYGRTDGLRTLDSLHLALALDLYRTGLVDSLVTADQVLGRVALLQGLPVLDPEKS